ncbi:MAG: rhomboid family intramembrane serine protease [Rhodothermales bacterium]
MNQFQSWYRMQPPALRALLTINVVLYGAWLILRFVPAVGGFMYSQLALNADLGTVLFKPWQFITYNFLHLGTNFWGLIHILFNMLWLVWIGREYEELHGSHRLLAAYLITGVGGGLLTVLLHALFPSVAAFGGIVYGASASVLGIMTVVAILYPFKTVGLILIGNIRLLYLVIAVLVLNVVFMSDSNTAVAAHLGGALFGFLFAKAESSGVDLSSWTRIFFRQRSVGRGASAGRGRSAQQEGMLKRIENWLATRNTRKAPKSAPPSVARSASIEVELEVVEPTLENEVDRILDKISAKGYDALTAEEKRILFEASQR